MFVLLNTLKTKNFFWVLLLWGSTSLAYASPLQTLCERTFLGAIVPARYSVAVPQLDAEERALWEFTFRREGRFADITALKLAGEDPNQETLLTWWMYVQLPRPIRYHLQAITTADVGVYLEKLSAQLNIDLSDSYLLELAQQFRDYRRTRDKVLSFREWIARGIKRLRTTEQADPEFRSDMQGKYAKSLTEYRLENIWPTYGRVFIPVDKPHFQSHQFFLRDKQYRGKLSGPATLTVEVPMAEVVVLPLPERATPPAKKVPTAEIGLDGKFYIYSSNPAIKLGETLAVQLPYPLSSVSLGRQIDLLGLEKMTSEQIEALLDGVLNLSDIYVEEFYASLVLWEQEQ